MRLLAIVSLTIVAACSAGGDEAGLTPAEDRQLDEAAAALDEAQAEYETAIEEAQPASQPADSDGDAR